VKKAWGFIKDVFHEWSARRSQEWSDVVAYHTIFSLAPVLVMAIIVAGLVVGGDAARSGLMDNIRGVMGETGARAVESLLQGFQEKGKGLVAVGVSALVLLWGASGLFVSLRNALDYIWELEKKPGIGIRGFLKDRLVSFALVLSVGFVLLVSLLLSAAMIGFRQSMSRFIPIPSGVLPVLDFSLSFLVISFLFTLIFKFLPSVVMDWRDAAFGALATTVLFVMGKSLLGYFLSSEGLTSSYGAASSLVLVILWVNYSARILFVGAAVIKVRARRKNRPLRPGAYAVRSASYDQRPMAAVDRRRLVSHAGAFAQGPDLRH
jgi:membrane protein